ncbi:MULTISPECIES: acyltransferase family protein [Actinosynnema]|uniref:acyltransferase family protein n=1 Tax=Actinosynnema TaxID=40566 RepID=UPI0020A398F5|nr:acyltransferase family protein [Actinosynnema pretiosum]MCP2099093.1 Peptidoglycan/LPS O-acetylase OafA/YrhL, contains acyltransferase and SGNH-hydrolase domains [Actinosynnema pretiosum]
MTSTETLREAAPRGVEHRSRQRDDIQGLRALAVGLVLVYHLRPTWLPGGFVGVDVFFVISGYLIIGALVNELRRNGRISLFSFYARRARRLLPAATVVLLGVALTTALLLPVSRHPDVLREVVASALNVQNWQLAIFAGDYANATAEASPVQHFWSLSVEEQFYLVIPLVLILAGMRGARPGRNAFAAVLAITVASLAFSVYYTPLDHTAAYFITPTRMWELGIGGLLAIGLPRLALSRTARLVTGWLGLAAVLAAAFLFTTAMQFPGWIALLPVLGAAALLAAGSGTGDGGVSALLARQPLRYLGDISYSLYLWHWPVLVFLLEFQGAAHLSAEWALVAAAASVALAALSTRLVETPLRHLRPRAAYALGATMIVASVLAAAVPWYSAQARIDDLKANSVLGSDHPGALVMDPAFPAGLPTATPVPDPVIAGDDIAKAWDDDCGKVAVDREDCWYGPADAPKTMVLLGDSHMTQLSGALIDLAERSGQWRVRMLVHDACPFNAEAPKVAAPDGKQRQNTEPFANCPADDRAKRDWIVREKPDMVVTAAMTPEVYKQDMNWEWPSYQRAVDGYREILRPIAEAGVTVVGIRDTPRSRPDVLACLIETPGQCDRTRAEAVTPDPVTEAVATLPGGKPVDLTDWFCDATTCPAVVGNVVVYRDNHITDTYASTLVGPLGEALGIERR